jgi:hypothetical protein
VGVNAFLKTDVQGLNFAISAKDVRAFLASPAKQIVESDCKPRAFFEGRNKDNTAFIRNISLKCDDRADIAADPKPVVLNLMQPLAASGQLIGFGWEARRDEPGRQGMLQHGVDS